MSPHIEHAEEQAEAFLAREHHKIMSGLQAMTENPPVDAKGDVDLQTAAAYVLNYGIGKGWEPGSFYELLIKAMFAADLPNLHTLSKGFPMTAWCVLVYKNHVGGVERLEGLLEVDGSVLPVEFGGDDQEPALIEETGST